MQAEEEFQIESLGYYVGLDLGQSKDYTALVVLEAMRHVFDQPTIIRDPSQESRSSLAQTKCGTAFYHARHIVRIPLGTSYVDVVKYVRDEIIGKLPPRSSTLIADATGVGAGIMDMLDEAGLPHIRVMVHGGNAVTKSKRVWHIPKRDLVGAAKALLSKGELRIVKGPYTQDLVRELEDFRVNISASGHDSYEASWREGAHDDLVFAVSLACYYAREKMRKLSHGKAQPVIEMEKGAGSAYDPTRRSVMRDAGRGGRFSGLTGFRSGGFKPP
jgi:hypothetical protein